MPINILPMPTRVPIVDPTKAQRILRTRRKHLIGTWPELQAIGVAFSGISQPAPARANQLKLNLLQEGAGWE